MSNIESYLLELAKSIKILSTKIDNLSHVVNNLSLNLSEKQFKQNDESFSSKRKRLNGQSEFQSTPKYLEEDCDNLFHKRGLSKLSIKDEHYQWQKQKERENELLLQERRKWEQEQLEKEKRIEEYKMSYIS